MPDLCYNGNSVNEITDGNLVERQRAIGSSD